LNASRSSFASPVVLLHAFTKACMVSALKGRLSFHSRSASMCLARGSVQFCK
jgi:hypothetical protein